MIVGQEVTAWPEQGILEQEQQEVGLDTLRLECNRTCVPS